MRVFAHYQRDHDNPNSLSDNWVRSFYEDSSGAIWIGTAGGGLNQFDPENERFTHYVNDPANPDSLSDNHVSHISHDSEGMLWIGTLSGLDKLDPSTGIFTHYQHDSDDSSSLSENNGVVLIIEDREGVLWVGTGGGGLNRFDQETETFRRFLHDPNNPQSLINNDVWNIVVPYLLEGAALGLLGRALSLVILKAGFELFRHEIRSASRFLGLDALLTFFPFHMCVVLVCVGLFLGCAGSFLSLLRFGEGRA